MNIKSLFILLISLIIISCSKNETRRLKHAEILEFNSDKCGCCWGWTIKVDNELIKTAKLPNPGAIGYDIKNPIPVIIELGNQDKDCTFSEESYYNYYEIKSLEIVKK